jgi:SpoVK/Ycf46/Vps4 family AAA+-type ATPase
MVHISPPDSEALSEIISSKLGKNKEEEIPCEIGVQEILGMCAMNAADGYYSGADVCGIIEEACRLAIQQLIETNSTEPIPLTRELFEKAFAKKKPSIPREALESYASFSARVDEIK